MIIQKHEFLVFVMIFLLFSCTKDKLVPVENDCPDEVTYDNQIEEIINTTCAYAGCHDGSGSAPGDYRTYAAMRPWLRPAQFDDRTIILRDMPPNYADGPKTLTQDEIDLVTCWILNNYDEN